MKLTSANIVVTGASRGIGRALIQVLVARGAHVVLVARSTDALEAVAASVAPGRTTVVPADLADPDALDGLVARIEATAGPVDVLVNNAGIDHTGPCDAVSAAELRTVVDVNLIATAELCRQAVVPMTARGHGHIVNVSSIGGSLASAGVIVYCATKAGVNQFTAGLRAELKGSGVGTTLVEIGPVATQMMDGLREYGPTAASVRRLERAGLSPELDPGTVAIAIAEAIESGRKHLRMPKRQAAMSMLAEAPRRIGEWLTLGLDTRPPR